MNIGVQPLGIRTASPFAFIKRWHRTKLLRTISTRGVHVVGPGLEVSRRAAPKLTAAIREGEKIVDYPTSFLNLPCLLNDKVANAEMQVRDLMETDHPLVDTLRTLFSNTGTSIWSLIILLFSKANHSTSNPHSKSTSAILPTQRSLTEIVEMIRVSHVLHQSILNTGSNSNSSISNSHVNRSSTGNKLTLLGGDHFLAQALKGLGELRNTYAHELISAGCRDLFESGFVGVRDSQNQPLPSKPTEIEETKARHLADDEEADMGPLQVKCMLGSGRSEWTLRNLLDGASLLGKACQATLTLAHKPHEHQRQAYFFGRAFALAEKARDDAEIFLDDFAGPFSLVSAPVLLHLEERPAFYAEIEKGVESVTDVDYKKIWLEVRDGNGVALTKELQREHLDQAYNILRTLFQHSDARKTLIDILRAIEVR